VRTCERTKEGEKLGGDVRYRRVSDLSLYRFQIILRHLGRHHHQLLPLLRHLGCQHPSLRLELRTFAGDEA
jgi:hypothetical protein